MIDIPQNSPITFTPSSGSLFPVGTEGGENEIKVRGEYNGKVSQPIDMTFSVCSFPFFT
jgi:hypothetical protein